ncbi:MAG: DUF296 domain-containing protein [Methanobacteriota archaeon]|nr:MAG: DUF296 domain-containing protein [Euryarchaeota archaeon]
MQIARKGDTIFIRLDHGEDVLESLSEAIREERSTLVLTAGLGMISEFEIGYFDNGNYVKKSFEEAHELLSMQGSVATEGDPRLHIHVTVADRSHSAFGGHLVRGRVWMSNEIAALRIEGLSSSRQMDPVKKVGILQLKT